MPDIFNLRFFEGKQKAAVQNTLARVNWKTTMTRMKKAADVLCRCFFTRCYFETAIQFLLKQGFAARIRQSQISAHAGSVQITRQSRRQVRTGQLHLPV